MPCFFRAYGSVSFVLDVENGIGGGDNGLPEEHRTDRKRPRVESEHGEKRESRERRFH